MNHSKQYAKELNTYLLSLEVIREYQKYENLLKHDLAINECEARLKTYQQKIVNQKSKGDITVRDTIDKYQYLKAEFENNPLVVNYLYLKEEVDSLLQSINSYINGQLLK